MLTLGACAGSGTPTPSTTPHAEASSTSPSATPTPVQDPADPTTWIVSADGVGPARLGQSVAGAVAAMSSYVDVSDPAGCPNPRVTFLGPAGSTVANAPLLLIADEQGSLVGIAFTESGPRTVDGIGVGSTAAAVAQAYPHAVPGTRGPSSVPNLVTVQGIPGWISFELDGGGTTIDQVSVTSGGPPPYEYCG